MASSASAGTSTGSPTVSDACPNGRLIVVLSQLFSITLRRLVASAIGRIVRPDRRASVTMPRPASRGVPCGMSAIMATFLPPSSAFLRAISARAPPFSRCFVFSRPPEPRTASKPIFSITSAFISASALRDTITTSGSPRG